MITTTDPIADMLSRIRNAILINKSEVTMPHSSAKEAVARLLKDNHFLADVQTDKATIGKSLNITISTPQSTARITEITRLSKPGRRLYVGVGQIPTVKRGRGMIIVSTSKGMMTGDSARAAGIGGELICKVY